MTIVKELRISVNTPTFNAGETTRAVEIAKTVRASAADHGREVDIRFASVWRDMQTFEDRITAAGFPIDHVDVGFTEQMIAQLMRADHEGEQLFNDPQLVLHLITGCREWLEKTKPNLMLRGFEPISEVAARLTGIPTVTFLPFPPHRPWIERHMVKDIPDPLENRLTWLLPRSARSALSRLISRRVMRSAFFTQPTICEGARAAGIHESRLDLIDLLCGDLQLINDLPDYYAGQDVGDRCIITGPLFATPSDNAQMDAPIEENVLEAFAPDRRNRVFIAMGSSGEIRFLQEAIAAVATGNFNAVVLVPPSLCREGELTSAALPKNVVLVDRFVPAHKVNPLAEVSIIHGGQGTVQTAVASGTPIVGVAMQAEQQSNLDTVVAQGAGIRIPQRYWNARTVRAAVERALRSSEMRVRAARLRDRFQAVDGHRGAARAIWDFVAERGL